jgi:hypothetical protein
MLPRGFSALTPSDERALVDSVATELPPGELRKITTAAVGEGDCRSGTACVADPIAAMIVAGGERAPEIARERTLELLAEIRTDDPDGAGDLLGVVVNVTMELSGLRGEQLMLWWQMFPSSSQVRLFDPWLRTTPAFRLHTTQDEDAASMNLWVPLPTATGPYRVQVGLSSDDASIPPMDTGLTDPFDGPLVE